MKRRNKKKKSNVYGKASDLNNDLLGIYVDEYSELSDVKRKKIESKYDPTSLLFETCNYTRRFQNEELTDTTRKSDKEDFLDLSDMPSLESDGVKERK